MNVKMIKGFMPKVYINNNAMNKMQEYIRQCDNEIGWLGCAEKIDGAYHITDVFLFEQEVHSTTTEITTEGLNNNFTRCEECDEYYHNENNEIRYCEECERYICADCMDFHGDICEECFDEKNAEREEA